MKAVLFDLGHTLIDYHNDWRGSERRAVETVSQEVCDRLDNGARADEVSKHLLALLEAGRAIKLSKQIEIPLVQVLEDCFSRFEVKDAKLMDFGLENFYAVLLEGREIVPGTEAMLQTVKRMGYGIGLVSDVAWGLPSYFPLKDMRFYGLDDYFDDMVFSTDVGLRKPNPKIFEIALQNLGSSPVESIFVGNNLQADIKGALDVGMTAVLKRSNFYSHDDSIVPSAKISDWNELLSLLRGTT
jgi:putative hydrolase of the HAD superfamily